MDIRVSGHRVDTGDALQTHVTDRLQGIANKYFQRTHSAHATFSKGAHDHGFACDIVMHVVKGVVLKASHNASDAHPALMALPTRSKSSSAATSVACVMITRALMVLRRPKTMPATPCLSLWPKKRLPRAITPSSLRKRVSTFRKQVCRTLS